MSLPNNRIECFLVPDTFSCHGVTVPVSRCRCHGACHNDKLGLIGFLYWVRASHRACHNDESATPNRGLIHCRQRTPATGPIVSILAPKSTRRMHGRKERSKWKAFSIKAESEVHGPMRDESFRCLTLLAFASPCSGGSCEDVSDREGHLPFPLAHPWAVFLVGRRGLAGLLSIELY